MTGFSYLIAGLVVAAWAIIVARFLYDQAVVMGGKLAPHRPNYREVLFSCMFLLTWGVPSAIFLAIWGGIFWW
jgi:hypothetical protein